MSGLDGNRDSSVGTEVPARRQAHRRVSARVPIRISTIDPDKDPESGKLFFFTSDEFSADLSRGGAFVVTPEPIEPGRRLLVEVDIPGGSNFQTIGRVVWNRVAGPQTAGSVKDRSGIGIRFTNGRPDLFQELERYVEKTANRRRPTSEVNPSSQVAT
jgi:Tfp pilus assembly protein PilZ